MTHPAIEHGMTMTGRPSYRAATAVHVVRQKPLRVLLVEDDPGDARLVAEAFAGDADGDPITHTWVRTISEALAALESASTDDPGGLPDIVLLDLDLPDSCGIATFERLHAACPHVPVMVLTGLADSDLAVAAVHAGAQDFLVKGGTNGPLLRRLVRHAVERHEMNLALGRSLRQRNGLVELGRLALQGPSLPELLDMAVRVAAESLQVPLVKILTHEGTAAELRVSAGAGFASGVVGTALVDAGPGTQAGFTLTSGRPVVTPDLRDEVRFAPSPILIAHGAVSGVSVVIDGVDAPYGVLTAHARQPRSFTEDDLEFLEGVAYVVAETLRRERLDQDLRERIRELSTIADVSRLLQQDVSVDDVGQAVTTIIGAGRARPEALYSRMQLGAERWCTGAPDTADAPPPAAGDSANELSAPIVVGGVARGELVVGYRQDDASLSTHERRMLGAVAEILGLWLQRRASDEVADEGRRRLQLVLEQVPGVLWTTDGRGRITSYQGAGLARLGLDPSDRTWIGQPIEVLATVYGSDPAADNAFLAGVRGALAGERASFEGGTESLWWQLDVRPLRGPDDELAGTIGLALDITDLRHTHAALDESRTRMQAIFDAARDAMLLADDEGHYLDANPAAAALLGVSQDELRGLEVMDITPSGDRDAGRAAWQAFLREGEMSGEYAVTTSDGRILQVEYRAVANIVPGVHLSVMRDVTGRATAQQALRRSEERFRALVQQAWDAVAIYDGDGRVVFASPAIRAILGYEPDQLVGHPALSYVHPADRQAVTALWEDALASGSAGPVRFRVVDRRGEPRWVEEVITNLSEDPAVGGLVGNLRDISEQTHAEQRLRASEARFRRLAENAQDVVYRVTLQPRPRVDYLSPAVERMTGYRLEELLAAEHLVDVLFVPEDRPAVRAFFASPDETTLPGAARWQRRDGRLIWVEHRYTVIHDTDGVPLAVEGIVRDVTERQRSEEALRAALDREREASERLQRLDEMKNAFLTAVSHELRTPLTAVEGFAKVLQRMGDDLPPERRALVVDRLVQASDRLGQLLSELLDLDRLTRGILEPVRTPVDVATVVQRAVEHAPVPDANITLSLTPTPAEVDTARVERIVENLVVNAVRHTPTGTPVRVTVEPADGGAALVSVADHGQGVPDPLKHRIFEPFQLGETPAARVGGAGIGLTLVARFAELHGGRAWVTDTPGGGATFHVLLPSAAAVV